MAVRKTGRAKDRARYTIHLEPLSPGIDYRVHNNTLENLTRGIVERVFRVKGPDGKLTSPPEPEPGAWEALRIERFFTRRNLSAYRISRQEFVELCPARKRKVYSDAVDSLQRKPLTHRDAYVSTFGKKEKINFSEKPDPPMRVIQPRKPRYNVEVGRYLKPIEHKVYHLLDYVFDRPRAGRDRPSSESGSKVEYPSIMKGYNAAQVAKHVISKWKACRKPVAFVLDANRFDQHVRQAALKFEHRTYAQFFSPGDRGDLLHLLRMQLRNKCFARCPEGLVKYTTDGCRMSGDMNTALGNVVLMCSMLYEVLTEVGLVAGVHYHLVNNGDDSTIIFDMAFPLCRRLGIDGIQKQFASCLRFGFTVRVDKICYRLQEVVFCQTHPFETAEGPLMVRAVPQCLAKDTVCLLPIHDREGYFKWLSAVGQCGMSIAGGLPVLDSFYRCLLRLGGGDAGGVFQSNLFADSGFFQLGKGMARSSREPTPEERVQFYYAFGVTPDIQRWVEHYYDNYDPEWVTKPSLHVLPTSSDSESPKSEFPVSRDPIFSPLQFLQA